MKELRLTDGQFSAADEVPAGEYILMLNSADLRFRILDSDGEPFFDLTLNTDGSRNYILNRIHVSDGNILDVTGSIFLMPYLGHDLDATIKSKIDADEIIANDSARMILPFFEKP